MTILPMSKFPHIAQTQNIHFCPTIGCGLFLSFPNDTVQRNPPLVRWQWLLTPLIMPIPFALSGRFLLSLKQSTDATISYFIFLTDAELFGSTVIWPPISPEIYNTVEAIICTWWFTSISKRERCLRAGIDSWGTISSAWDFGLQTFAWNVSQRT